MTELCPRDLCRRHPSSWCWRLPSDPRVPPVPQPCVHRRPCVTGFWGALEKEVSSPSAGQPELEVGQGLHGVCSHPPSAGLSHTPSPRRTGTKQVAKKWCHCVMSNPYIIKILFEQMSQEASGPVSQAGAAKFFWPSVMEPGVSVWLALAGIAVMG